mmetsp:Transcript_60763/g.72155  ORF Transcript_60763/g.72155 Transcript_60763/m.72155 type:complete len:687 (+) Transcript_60763:14-2074(+)
MKTRILIPFLLLLRHDTPANADFGDTGDPYFPNCPAFVTCPIVCVANATDCPEHLQCAANTQLCADGRCAATCDDDNLESPCLADCASFACARIDDYLPNCYERFGDLYDEATACAEEEVAAATHLYTFTEPGFVFYYAWMSVVTFLILGWCAFNQRLAPVHGSTLPLKEAVDTEGENMWSQTAYRSAIIGNVIYILVWITILGIQALLTLLTIYYYVQQEMISFPNGEMVFESEEQVLLAFIVVWMVSVVWYLALKWPYSVRSLFLRRCLFENATHVAVFAPTESIGEVSSRGVSCTEKMIFYPRYVVNEIMGFIFSDFSHRNTKHGKTVYCQVTNEKGNRFFYFRQRRYTFSLEEGAFVPGKRSLSTNQIQDMKKARDGLERTDAEKKEMILGSNKIHLRKPNFFRVAANEFTGVFYLYQAFMIWTWFPLYYYYMAIVYTIIVFIGGISVSIFKHKNEKSLYQLSSVSGNVLARRDGKYESIDHKRLVPGDVVKLTTGPVFADMVVLDCTTIAVDESALTGEATPVSKASIESLDGNTLYDPLVHKRQTISAGTTILESSNTECDIGLVTSTGSFTRKGEMLRSILSYERHRFKFDYQVQLLIPILFVVGVITFVITGFVLIKDDWIYGWFYGVYVFVTALPALLPTVFVVSVGVSDNRLSKKGIACINSEAILIAGKVRAAFF